APDRNPFPLNTLFETLSTEFTVLAAEQGVDFKVHGSRLRVDSDIRLLRRVLQNFLTNAFRYAKGRVVLGVRRQGNNLRLEVWDRGPGIAKDKLQVILDRKSTRLNSSHVKISYAVFCLKKKKHKARHNV